MAAPLTRLSQFYSLVCFHLGSKHIGLGQFSIGTLLCKRFASSRIIQNDGSHSMVEMADGNTIVCYHPSEPFPYENTKPIPRPDPSKPEKSVDSVLKMKMSHESWLKERRGPDVNELAKMFYTTKHRWYPLGIRRRSKAKRNPPRDRPYL